MATSEDPHEATAAREPAAAPTGQRKRSPYAMSKGDASARNIAWALGLTLGCVGLAGVIFFGVGRTVDREVPETSRLDVGASAQRAQEQAPFTVAEPALGKDWAPRAADYEAGERPTWTLRYTAPSNSLVTLVESEEVSAADLSTAMPGARTDGETTIEGVECQKLSADGEQSGISCQDEDWGLIIHGKTDEKELASAAKAAIGSIQDGAAGAKR
ncbi:DUF4245 domain-containing protein [Brachybacterium endophyticum]|uniref:DUF4245 domain-containing protein n=1 Tax=Brachybacterium endophyticum TaxID=2182385 RepID=A0A2U2RPS1_9MICO|nr:DUF4245 family protein [Brachybacterium endophyticum]PWH07856.1 DUF4245 domain-containing protein [Brachybacterium endophyticum]